MEKNKWQLILHEQVEDPYYEITNGPVSLIANCGFVGEDDADEENIFNRVKDELNVSGISFHSGNTLEIKQHIEILELGYKIAGLQAKCERHEEALKEAKETINWMWQHMKEPDGQTLLRVDEFNRPANALHVIDEALSGDGEKQQPAKQWWKATELPKYVKHKRGGWVDEHIGINHAGDCLVFVGRNDTIEWQFSFLQPATKEEYDAYIINQKEDQQ